MTNLWEFLAAQAWWQWCLDVAIFILPPLVVVWCIVQMVRYTVEERRIKHARIGRRQ